MLQCLREVPAIRNLNCTSAGTDSPSDFVIEVDTGRETYLLMVETGKNGQPRYARDAIARLSLKSGRSPSRAYPVFAAPFISKAAAEICIEGGAGYIDISGNCRLAFGGIYIERQGYPNRFVSRRSLQSLYRARSSRVLRALLFAPNLKWKLTDLSTAAGVSIGQVFNVKKALIDREWAVFEKEGLRLTQPEQLIRNWGEQHRHRKNTLYNFHSSDLPPEIESKLARHFSQQGLRYALTSFSASERLAPAGKKDPVFFYVDTSADTDIDRAANLLELEPAATGSNVTLMLPYDEGVFFGMREIRGVNTVSPVQAYLDLAGLGKKGDDAAEILFSQVIQKEWQPHSSSPGI